ncbi:membrane protein [Mycobacterium intracellulare]|uniref:Membrane protein n=1 Tax=Mycobacterium intracellulare TaxID=1767 RepID=A0A7R7MXY6_MYCIT|nr:membrane protein [Mycobacterium intracellulare]BCO75751.1 membrane protein [Mycobacterium intracellulare]BCO81215.1 membrane protein [Mycobacterium intracellulare]BCP02072.1 membrane protein [Mycobacterium intracellulare]BCP23180.1 membrane protein [Mycobacterium intracellulare]
MAAGIAALAAAVYALMWVGYRQRWAWLYRVDWSLLDGARALAIKHPSWLRFAESVSFVLGPGALAVLGISVTVLALVMRQLRAALVLVLACAPCNEFATAAVKALADRPRPPTMLVPAAATSFPSGHALEATAGLLAMLSFALPMMNVAARRIAVAAVAVALPAVGLSRVALNVHYPSDVLAGWSLGYLYFLVCLWVFRPPAPTVRAKALRRWAFGHGAVT